VGGRGVAVVAERRFHVGVVLEVLRDVEGVGLASFGLAKVQVMLLARGAVGAQGLDQVVVGGDVLQAVEPRRQPRGRLVGPTFPEAELDIVGGRGVAVVAEGRPQVGVAGEVAALVEGVGLAPLDLAEGEVMLLAGGLVGTEYLY
jgi:hypothetical protein